MDLSEAPGRMGLIPAFMKLAVFKDLELDFVFWVFWVLGALGMFMTSFGRFFADFSKSRIELGTGDFAAFDGDKRAAARCEKPKAVSSAVELDAVAILPDLFSRQLLERSSFDLDAFQGLEHALAFCFPLEFIRKVLPLAATALAKDGAGGLLAQGRRPQNLDQLGLGVALFGVDDSGSNGVARCCERHENDPAIGPAADA